MNQPRWLLMQSSILRSEDTSVLADWYKKQMEIKAREEGRAEVWGIWQKWQIDLDAWEERRAMAVSEGREFSEPRPEPPQPNS